MPLKIKCKDCSFYKYESVHCSGSRVRGHHKCLRENNLIHVYGRSMSQKESCTSPKWCLYRWVDEKFLQENVLRPGS